MKPLRSLALLSLVLPVALAAQNTILNDSFTGDSLNPATYPAVTASTTGWNVLSNKAAPAPTESGGVLTINMAATSSGFVETQALFAAAPVQLLPGTYLELTTTFVPTNVLASPSDNLLFGFYNSGGSAPLSGMLTSGLSSALTTFASGGAKGWIGYNAKLPISGSPAMLTRPAQTGTNNTVQDVLVDGQSASVGYTTPASASASSISALSATLVNGSTYTLDYKLSLSADGLTLTAAVSLYNGTGTTGSGANTLIVANTGKFSGATLLTKSFDALALGWRADTGTATSNLKISALSVKTTGGTPWFTAPPPASILVSIGSDLNLVATAAGLVTGYQWQVSTDGGATFANLDPAANPSAATAALTITNVQNATAGRYRLVATNAAGPTASAACVVGVSATPVAPSVLTNPSDATALGGTAQSFTVTVNGTSPLTYQWEQSADGTTFAPVAGATGATYTIAAVSLADEGYYRVTVTNVAGSATSTAARLTVNQPLTITGQPVGAALNLGASYTLSATAIGKPAPTYQWYLNGAAIAGATGSTYTIASASAASAGIYTVVASNSAGDTVTSSGAAVAVLSSSLASTASTPAATPTGVAPDTRLTLTFNQAVSVGSVGTIRIYDAANPTTPVDTIDLVAATAQMKALRATSTLSTLALPVQTKTIGGATGFNYYPITVAGNTATIYPRDGVLAYGKTYFVTVDAGVFTDSTGLAFAGISGSAGWTFATKITPPSSSAAQLVVAADGSGDFYTVQAALDSIPANNTTPRTIFIRAGTYFEEIYFTAKHDLTILGEDIDQTAVVYPNNAAFNSAGGVYHRATFYPNGVHDVTIANLTVNNTTPQNGSQAEAIIVSGTSPTAAHNVITRCKFYSYQDTVQFNNQLYVSDSTIVGDVDFMWGGGPTFLQNCDIRILRSGAYFTQVRNGNGNHGFVFAGCRFTAPVGITGTFLGRIDPTAFPYSEVVLLDSTLGDATNNAFLATTTGVSGANYLGGWWLLNNAASAAAAPTVHDWANSLVTGTGASLVNPNTDLFTTMPTDATTQANYRNATWVLNTNLAGTAAGSWAPALAPQIVTAPSAQTVNAGSGFTLSVKAVGLPTLSYQWLRNGAAIPGATGATYTVANSGGADAGTYSVVVSNASGSVTTTAVSLVVHGAAPVIMLPPANTLGLLGATATLNAWAVGDGPFTYQWLKDGAPLVGATNQALRLTGLQASDAGSYAVAITNAGGTTTSAGATLTTIAPATTLPTVPQIPAGIFDVTAYGAVGDGATDNTAAIQAALNAANAAGGGTVELPPAAGAYLCGPITLYSHTNFQVDAGATLQALPYGVYPNSYTAPAHFVNLVANATDVEFSGGGTIDGNGAAWWAAYGVTGPSTPRFRLVQISTVTNMLVTGTTFSNSPTFHLAFRGPCLNVTIFGATVSAPGNSPNTDGMDICGTNILVQNCSVSDGDDNIVAKPGGTFCRNIYIANCAIGTGHGVSIGGQTNVGLDGMVVTNCTFNGTSSALRLKADPTEGGPVQNVTFSNLTMTNVTNPILFYSYYDLLGSPGATSGSSQITPAKANAYNISPPDSLALPTIPTWKNITVTNLTVTNGSGYSTIWGLPTASGLIANVTLNNVNIQGGAGLELYDAANVQLTGTNSVGPILTANALAITGQPGGQTVNVGDSVAFSAAAVGGSGTNNTGLTYQWNLNGVPLANGVQADGSTVSGAATATLTLTNARVTDAGSYTMTASTALDGYNTATNVLVANSLPVSATSSAATLTVNPLPVAISLSGLTLTYDGTPQSPVVTTTPSGVAVALTYDGGTSAPVNAGSYVVVATPADANYFAAPVSGILTIQPAAASVALAGLAAVYDGTPKSATATTTPVGLQVDITYDGGTAAPTNAGSYAVVATVDDPNYAGSASGILTVAKAVANVTLGNLSQTYDGAPKPASVLTNPGGLAVALSYDGAPAAPVNAGSYAVVASVSDANYTGSAGGMLNIAKAVANVTLGNLSQTYDGAAKSVTVTTAPAGLNAVTTYNGSTTAPTNAGSYAVVVTLNEANYTGTASGTLTIGKAAATVTLAGLVQTYDGTPKLATASTTPAGLVVDLTYNGSTTAPANAGSYAVVGTVNDANYAGAASGSLVIAKAASTVTLGGLNQTYDGTAKPVTAVTTPAGLTVDLTYNGSAAAPTNAGSYAVVGTVNNANYAGAATGTLVVAKAVATVTLGNLSQAYNGAAKSVTVTTVPAGLNVVTTYNGNVPAPSAVGSYTVVSTVQEGNYVGTASGTLVITRASATVALSGLVQAYDGTPKPVSVTTTPANLTVSVTYNGGTTVPTYPGSYAVVATINETSYQGTANGTLVITTTAIVRHAPTLNGGIDGSLQVMTAEAVTLNGSALLGGDLLVPGTPSVQLNGHPVYAGTIDAGGVSAPTNYRITLNGNAALRHIVRQVDPVALPVVAAPPAPTGTRSVTLNNSSQSAGDFATVRNLTLNSNVGQVVVPAGAYGSFTINAGSGLTLGVAGATTPAVYSFQSLTLNGNSSVQVVGPVIITLANGTALNSSVGSVDHPDWLVINLAGGGLTLNGNVRCDGYVVAPNGAITINGNSTLNGGVICDQLTINGNGLLKVEDPE